MSNPVILITGALTGIGRATALAFCQDRRSCSGHGRRPAEGKALQVELQRLGAEAVFIEADVRHDDEVGGLIDQAVAAWPPRRGRQHRRLPKAARSDRQPDAQSYAAHVDTNVLGTLLSLKHELRVMTAQKKRQHHQISPDLRS